MEDQADSLVNLIFIAVTGLIAWHGLSFRDEDGKPEWVHMLFGSIALLYCLWILSRDVFGII